MIIDEISLLRERSIYHNTIVEMKRPGRASRERGAGQVLKGNTHLADGWTDRNIEDTKYF